MERSDKKAWSRPELTVISRGQPEEAVLWSCKQNAAQQTHTGPSAYDGECYVLAGGLGGCTPCDYTAGS